METHPPTNKTHFRHAKYSREIYANTDVEVRLPCKGTRFFFRKPSPRVMPELLADDVLKSPVDRLQQPHKITGRPIEEKVRKGREVS